MALDLAARDIERAKFAFSIYDFEGNNTIDAYDLGNCLRALDLVPTMKIVEKVGGTKKKGEKKMKVDEFLPIYAQVKKDKDIGNIEDFTECLRLYDKQGDGMMAYDELKHILLSLGERLENDECAEILGDCADKADEDGFTAYRPFLDRLMAGPPEKAAK